MNLSAIIDALISTGGTVEQVAAVVRAAEAQRLASDAERAEHKREGNAERQRRNRERNALSRVTDVTERDERYAPIPLFPNKETPPAPPKEINLNPPYPQNSVGSPAAKRRQAPNRAPEYPDEFNLLWREFPFQANASKKDAFTAWAKLPEEDRDKCFDGALAYASWLEGERRRRPDYPAKHLSTFINARGFESLLEARR